MTRDQKKQAKAKDLRRRGIKLQRADRDYIKGYIAFKAVTVPTETS